MDLNISKMEQFSKMQIECLEMMQGLIAYDKEESANALPNVLVKHKKCLLSY